MKRTTDCINSSRWVCSNVALVFELCFFLVYNHKSYKNWTLMIFLLILLLLLTRQSPSTLTNAINQETIATDWNSSIFHTNDSQFECPTQKSKGNTESCSRCTIDSTRTIDCNRFPPICSSRNKASCHNGNSTNWLPLNYWSFCDDRLSRHRINSIKRTQILRRVFVDWSILCVWQSLKSIARQRQWCQQWKIRHITDLIQPIRVHLHHRAWHQKQTNKQNSLH